VPLTTLAHYGELEWAAGFGAEAGLVRVSVGMEDKDDDLKLFEVALNAARIQAQVESQ
jgi:cystathionine gamma-synthase